MAIPPMTHYRHRLGVLVIIVTIGLWGWFGFRVLAYNTGQLGPVTLGWQNFQEPHQVLTLDPLPTTPTVTLEPGSAYTVLIKKPWRFQSVRVTTQATGPLLLTPVMEDGSVVAASTVTPRIAFTALLAQHGVYRIRIDNTGTQAVTLNRVTFTIWP